MRILRFLDSYNILHLSLENKQSVFEMMVRKGEGSYAKKDAELDMLHRVVAYCLNEVDCRRQVVLEHFGEHFNSADCRGTCDNCSGGFAVEAKDLTKHAQSIVRLFMSVRSVSYIYLYLFIFFSNFSTLKAALFPCRSIFSVLLYTPLRESPFCLGVALQRVTTPVGASRAGRQHQSHAGVGFRPGRRVWVWQRFGQQRS